MKNSLTRIFGKDRNIIIGAIHLPPLLGHSDFPGFEKAVANALADLEAFEGGGADAVLFENNYDHPHYEIVPASVAVAMRHIGEVIVRSAKKVPVGVSVLWNDYRTALGLAKTLGLAFVRIPVFVDDVKTSYGVFRGKAREVIRHRRALGAEGVAVFSDVHVKHARILSKHTLAQSARLAVKRDADALIVTGNWTGDAPNMDDLKTAREAVADFPILIGSGLDRKNCGLLFRYANGAIVGTSVKDGGKRKEEVNVKGYDQRISRKKVRELISAANRSKQLHAGK